MKKFSYLLASVFILTACGTNEDTLYENSNSVYPAEAEMEADDFVYRLFTEKESYDEFGDIAVFAELTYIGDKESIEISHAASPFYFPIEERSRGYKIGYAMAEPLLTTTLKKGEPLREKYTFAGGYSDTDDQEYVEFIKTLMNEGFLDGSCIVNGSAQFSLSEPTDELNEETFNMNVNIGFTINK